MPVRSCVERTGGFECARKACSWIICEEDDNAKSETAVRKALLDICAGNAVCSESMHSTSARSEANESKLWRAGAWLNTEWVGSHRGGEPPLLLLKEQGLAEREAGELRGIVTPSMK